MDFFALREFTTRGAASCGEQVADGSASQYAFNVGERSVEFCVKGAEFEMVCSSDGALFDSRNRIDGVDDIEHRQLVRVDRQGDPAPFAPLC